LLAPCCSNKNKREKIKEKVNPSEFHTKCGAHVGLISGSTGTEVRAQGGTKQETFIAKK
jgi:hypothetical protein